MNARIVSVTTYNDRGRVSGVTHGHPVTIGGILPAIVSQDAESGRWWCTCMRSGLTLLGPYAPQLTRDAAIQVASRLVSARSAERIGQLVEAAIDARRPA